MANVNNQKSCKVCTIGVRFIIVQFDSYGLKINVEDTTKYKMGESVLVDYSGTVGKKNFQYALSTSTNTVETETPIKKPAKSTRKTKKIEEESNE